MSNTTATPAPAALAQTTTITLDAPIVRGEQTIGSLTLRKPGSGELRGLKLTDVMQMDVAALIALLPRISAPTLTQADVSGLDPADLMQAGSAVVGFFITRADRAALGLTA